MVDGVNVNLAMGDDDVGFNFKGHSLMPTFWIFLVQLTPLSPVL
jgi:hypothetical protein